jgi:SAM-dependent MidA family methyltransferase
MELALYSPAGGYYETHERTIGRRGDYFTSVSVGPVYGQILGSWMALGLRQLGAGPLRLAEAGAHDGRLAADVLSALARQAPDLLPRLEYVLVEPSPVRRAWQQERLRPWADRVKWVQEVGELGSFRGILFSNELLDAFPVERLRWNAPAGCWEVMGVVEREGRLEHEVLARSGCRALEILHQARVSVPPELAPVLPDGFTIELSPPACRWWERAGAVLQQGWIVGVDYGFGPGEWLRPERPDGTLRAYSGHQASRYVLVRPGEQDLTAHVNFESIEAAGLACGLRTEELRRQGDFLVRVLQRECDAGVDLQWSAAERRQFQTLVHPSHLGHLFRVLVQSRDMGGVAPAALPQGDSQEPRAT